MGRRKYKDYIKDSFNRIPRQTLHNKRLRCQLEANSAHLPAPLTSSPNQTTPSHFHPDLNPANSRQQTELEQLSSSEDENEEFGDSFQVEEDGTDYDDELDTVQKELQESIFDDKMYPDSQLTVKEGALLLYSFVIRHGISSSAIEDVLALLQLFLPSSSKFPRTKHTLKTTLGFDYSSGVRHYFCPACKCTIESTQTLCPNCDLNIPAGTLKQSSSFYVHFPIQDLLQQKLTDLTVANSLESTFKKRSNSSLAYRDIYDGESYKKLNLGPKDFSCSVNSDGVPVFKSSSISLWPILLSINEIDFSLRRKHTMIASLWFGHSKPNFDVFLKSFVEDSKYLAETGVKWRFQGNTIHSKVFFPIFVADSVARCVIQGINQFNGEYGCPWCLARGETLRLSNNRHKRIYPPVSKSKICKRYHSTFIEHLKKLSKIFIEDRSKKHFYGVRKASTLLVVPKFNIVDGFVFDYMHTILLGITRSLTNAWFDSRNHKEAFYISPKIQETISSNFIKFHCPTEVQRHPRSLVHRRFWKSSEWKVWLLVCPILLKEYFPSSFFGHLLLFVEAVNIFISKSISKRDLNRAEDLCFKFVLGIPNLYGSSFCSSNSHLLLHAGDCVRKWGPLINYSAFQYENFNQILLQSFRGSHEIVTQICNRSVEIFSLPNLANKYVLNCRARLFFQTQMSNRKMFQASHRLNNIELLGQFKNVKLSRLELVKVKVCGYKFVKAASFKKIIMHKKLFCVESKSKNSNCVVMCKGCIYILKKILLLSGTESENCIGFMSKLEVSCINSNSIPNMMKVEKISPVEVVMDLDSIEPEKYFCKKHNGKLLYIIRLPNIVEVE